MDVFEIDEYLREPISEEWLLRIGARYTDHKPNPSPRRRAMSEIKLTDDRISQIARGINPEGFEPACMAIEIEELRKQVAKKLSASELETNDMLDEIHSRSKRLIVFGETEDGEFIQVWKGSIIDARGLVAEMVTCFEMLSAMKWKRVWMDREKQEASDDE